MERKDKRCPELKKLKLSACPTYSSSTYKHPIMIFHPTWEEFQDFPKYIKYMESRGADKAGIAKVIPPEEYNPRKNGYDDINSMTIPDPISQQVTRMEGCLKQVCKDLKPMTVEQLKSICSEQGTDESKPCRRRCKNDTKYKTPPRPSFKDIDDLHRKYWRTLTKESPIYGADVDGTLMDPDAKGWNIPKLGTILDLLKSKHELEIKGVNTPYLYFGTWRSTFCWHTEDMDLYSINYLHFGEPKSWYAIAPEDSSQFETVAEKLFKADSKRCSQFLRHKMHLISPTVLKDNSIPYDKITQNEREFIITFPRGYHCGFNHGFNCAESTNFAMLRWIEIGKGAKLCYCGKSDIHLNMELFNNFSSSSENLTMVEDSRAITKLLQDIKTEEKPHVDRIKGSERSKLDKNGNICAEKDTLSHLEQENTNSVPLKQAHEHLHEIKPEESNIRHDEKILTHTYTCPICTKTFSKFGSFHKHLDLQHEGCGVPCKHCATVFANKQCLEDHECELISPWNGT